MADNAKLAVEIALENKAYLQKILASQKAMKGFGTAGKSAFKGIGSAIPKTLVAIAALAVSFKKLVETTDKQQKAEAQLNAVLKSTKGAAGLTADEIKNMASGLQEVTTFGDESILVAQNMLLTFTKIGRDVFPAATETVLNMAEAMGTDLKTQAIQVGKALNDPIQGVTALRRVGVQLSEQQQQQVKDFMAVGNIAGAQKIILSELQTEFGGVARAARSTLGGAVVGLKNKFGDLIEGIGNKLAPAFLSLIKSFSTASDSGGLFAQALALIVKPLAILIRGLTSVVIGVQRVANAFKDFSLERRIKLMQGLLELDKKSGDISVIEERQKKLNELLQQRKEVSKSNVDLSNQFGENMKGLLSDLKGQTKEYSDQNKALIERQKGNIGGGVTFDKNAAEKAHKDRIAFLQFTGQDELLKEEEIEKKRLELIKTHKDQEIEINKAAQDQIDEIHRLSVEKRIQQGLQLFSAASSIIGQIIALNQMATQNEISNLDRRHQAQRDQIENTIENEEERNAALAALDEQFEAEKRKIQREAAKKQKELQIYETALSIPTAAFQAYKSLAGIPFVGPGLGIAAAAAATVLGFKKLQLIKSQPLPALATGAIDVPSDMPAQIHRGETIIPKTFTDAIKAGEMTLGRQSEQVIRNVIIMDGQVIYDKISKATYDGRLPISSRAVI